MKKRVSAAVLLLLILVFFTVVLAQSGQFDLTWHSIDGGGGSSGGGEFVLRGAIGQPEAGSLSGGDFTLGGGFLVQQLSSDSLEKVVFLPLLSKPP
jgi:hypothetical protein